METNTLLNVSKRARGNRSRLHCIVRYASREVDICLRHSCVAFLLSFHLGTLAFRPKSNLAQRPSLFRQLSLSPFTVHKDTRELYSLTFCTVSLTKSTWHQSLFPEEHPAALASPPSSRCTTFCHPATLSSYLTKVSTTSLIAHVHTHTSHELWRS